jgi:hypothetical protein
VAGLGTQNQKSVAPLKQKWMLGVVFIMAGLAMFDPKNSTEETTLINTAF